MKFNVLNYLDKISSILTPNKIEGYHVWYALDKELSIQGRLSSTLFKDHKVFQTYFTKFTSIKDVVKEISK